ncbi:MAG TPA: AAA family ATPase [Alphaproteobacteria bacterium]|nr:AAA family ATPase [Alphaproteobacteria bacterium]
MGTLNDHHSQERTRVLLVGDPGQGKTSAIAMLAKIYKRVFVLDLDDGLDMAAHLLTDEEKERVHYITIREKIVFRNIGGKVVPTIDGVPEAFPSAVRVLNSWTDPDTGEEFGPPEEWGPDDCLVIDGLTHLAKAALWYTRYANKRMGTNLRPKDWQNAIERVEGVVERVNSGLPCTVVMTAHLARLSADDSSDDDDDDPKTKKRKKSGGARNSDNIFMRYPAAYGKKLPPTIGGYFNVVLQAKRVGHGANAQYVLLTRPEPDVDVKVPALPASLPVELPNAKLGSLVQHLQGKRKEV